MIAGRLHWRASGVKPAGRNRGIDVFASTLEEFRAALTAENRTLKRALTDPRILSGIGNAYSDEILHAAQLSQIALTRKLVPDAWERLHSATQSPLDTWTCPRCGEKIPRIRYADNETNHCARCQTGGKFLTDRALSRLLGADWPRTLDEVEMLKRE